MGCALLVSTVAVILSVIYFKQSSVYDLCDVDTCPYCYGKNMCPDIVRNKITLRYYSFSEIINNFLSVKNVYFAEYSGRKVVLKKLAYTSQLKKILAPELDVDEALKALLLRDDSRNFVICNEYSVETFLNHSLYENVLNLYTILQVNAEPVLLEIFNARNGWPVPELFGFCGRLAVVLHCGKTLNYVKNYDWLDRAYLAYQILQAAVNFTDGHESFRLYLTDISPDNIVFNEALEVSFVDLGNAVLKTKDSGNGTYHHSQHFNDAYAYSRKDICDAQVSDHNIYSVCRLLLSKYSPWPMMEGGLLHSPPEIVQQNYEELSEYIELCVSSPHDINRFHLSDLIINELKMFLKNLQTF